MTTFTLFNPGPYSVPGGTSWYLADLGEFRGKQELYTNQSPQRLKTLREHALIESAVSSNRMEGVTVDPQRVKNVLVSPKPLFRDRDEEEVRGYREALGLIHDHGGDLDVSDIERLPREFTLSQLEQASPGVSREMVHRVLNDQKGKTVECIGRGPGAKWIKKGNNS